MIGSQFAAFVEGYLEEVRWIGVVDPATGKIIDGSTLWSVGFSEATLMTVVASCYDFCRESQDYLKKFVQEQEDSTSDPADKRDIYALAGSNFYLGKARQYKDFILDGNQIKLD